MSDQIQNERVRLRKGMGMKLQIVGRPMSRVEGPEKVGGKTVYTADVRLPGMLWGLCLRSPHAHARILRIDTEKAKRVRGVKAVLSGNDLPPQRVGLTLRDMPLLAQGKVRFIGEKVVAVATLGESDVDENGNGGAEEPETGG